MRVRVWPSDRSGCGWYRLRWPALALQRAGFDVEVDGEMIGEHWPDGSLRRVLPEGADVCVVQRVYRPDLLAAMRSLREQGVAVIMDVDDELMALTPDHVMYPVLHPKLADSGRSWDVFREAVKEADLLTVSTPALQDRYGGPSRCVVIPNCIPRAYLGIRRQTPVTEPPVAGWTGTPATHPGDLEEMGTVIRDLCWPGQLRFRAIGDPATLRVLDVEWQQHQPGAPLADFSYAQAFSELDIAVVPLRLSAFNAAKSWLKMLEAASVGVPVIASPTAENLRLHALGVGVIARKPKEWRRELLRLAGSADLRLAVAAKGRAVAAGMTIEEHAGRWWEAWTLARTSVRRYAASGPMALTG